MISLLAGAAAGASGPGRALAALQTPRRGRSSDAPRPQEASSEAAVGEGQLHSMRLGDLRAGMRTVRPQRRFDLVGVSWQGDTGAIELRTLLMDGAWGRWAKASTLSHVPEARELARARRTGERVIGDPVWVGASYTLQLRLTRPAQDVTLHLVDIGGASRSASSGEALSSAPLLGVSAAAAHRDPHAARAFPRAQPVLPAGAGQPPILARSSWAGARSVPRVPPEYGDVQLAFVHHTENPNGYAAAEVPAMLRAIFLFHRDVQGWNDIGYNFVIDLFGRIFEARAGGIDEPVVGAQAGGYNAVSTGIAVLGDFSSQPISESASHALERLISWKLGLHGIPVRGQVTVHVDPAGAQYSRYPANAAVSLPRVAGHRDADATICPGDALYRQLPALRKRASTLTGPPALTTVQLLANATEPEAQADTEAGGTQPQGGASGAPEAGKPTPGAPESGAPEAGGSTTGASESGATHQLEGTLIMLGSRPIVGATIEVQMRSVAHRGEQVRERTIATATTASDGSWSVPVNVIPPPRRKKRKRRGHHPLPPQPVTPVRVLFKGGDGFPATVSTPLEVPGTLTAA